MKQSKLFLTLLILLVGIITPANAVAQGVTFERERIKDRLDLISEMGKKKGQSVTYSSDLPSSLYLEGFTTTTDDMEEWLYKSLKDTEYTYKKINKYNYTVILAPKSTSTTDEAVPAGKGQISGIIFDERGETIPGATIRVVSGPDKGKGASSSIDGLYTLDLVPGTYTIEVSSISYETKQITDIKVVSNKSLTLNVVLGESSELLDEVVITANYNNASAEGLYARQKAMVTMSDGLSASMIKRTSDNNIAQSLRRVSGVTITGGKHVTVRGMSDRYNNVTLNGSSLPSTEANQRNFSFDIIPTGLVDNITISKTFTPDLPGEFTGGLVEIKTLAVPEKKFLDVSLGTGMNTMSTGKPFRTNQRYTSDWFFGGVKERTWYAGRDNEEQSMQNAIQKNNYDMLEGKGQPTQNYSLTFGVPFEYGRHSFGVVGALTYRHEENTQETLAGTFLNEQNYYKPFGIEDLRSTSHTAVTNLGAVLNLGWKVPNHKVTLRNLLNNRFSHNGQLKFVDAGYYFDQVTYFHKPLQNIILQTQLEGEHRLFNQNINLTWLASYNSLNRTNPDNRLAKGAVVQQTGENQVLINWNATSDSSNRLDFGEGHMMYAKYVEGKSNIGLNVEYPFTLLGNRHSLKAGYLGTFRNAHFDQIYIKSMFQKGYLPSQDGVLGLYDFYQPERFNKALKYALTGFNPKDNYDGKQSIHAPYFMGTFSFFKKVQLIAGIRAEMSDMELQQKIYSWSDQEGLVHRDSIIPRQKTDWLPSVTAIYSIITDLNMRASYSKTIARPDFRELAWLNYTDPETRTNVISQEVKQSYIDNYDLRLEWYPELGEVLSLAYFYKKFLNPIETLQRRSGQIVDMMTINLEHATVYGIELNWRKSFGFIAPHLEWLHNLYFSGNYTWMGGSVKYNEADLLATGQVAEDMREAYQRERVLQGLAPYTFNLGLLYESDLWGVSLHYNQVGRKLIYGGRYPRYDIYENPRGVLDMQLYGRFLDQRMEVKFNVTDMLNQDIIKYANHGYEGDKDQLLENRMDQGMNYNEGDFVFSRVTKGVGLSMSVSYKF